MLEVPDIDDFTVETVSRTTVVLEEGELEKVSEDRVRDVQDLFHDLSIEDYVEKVEVLEETDMVEKEELEVDRMQQEYQEWVSWDRSKIMFSRPNTLLDVIRVCITYSKTSTEAAYLTTTALPRR